MVAVIDGMTTRRAVDGERGPKEDCCHEKNEYKMPLRPATTRNSPIQIPASNLINCTILTMDERAGINPAPTANVLGTY